MGTIVAIVNQKGGVGKTTTAINLAAALGALEKRVLLVDCDPQGNASRGLGVSAEPPNLYQVLAQGQPLAGAMRETGFPNLTVVPANRDLVGIEIEFVGQDGWESRLRSVLMPVIGDFDHILLDCPPSLGHLTVSALVAARRIVVPLQCEYFALEGVSELVSTVRRVRGRFNSTLEIAGILLTMYDERTNLARDVVNEIRRHFPGQAFETIVPRNVRLAEAPSHAMPILQYDIKSQGAKAYLALAEEFLRRCPQ